MSEPFCCLSLNSAWGPWVSFPISGPVAVSALRKLVGVAGFEPATPTSRTSAATEKFNDFHEVQVRSRSFVHVWLRDNCREIVGRRLSAFTAFAW